MMEADSPPPAHQAARKPMYEVIYEAKEGYSRSIGTSHWAYTVRNQHHLSGLSSAAQFKWLHRFYLVVDRVVEQHQVYKLFGGPQGLMISTNVAEPDPDHALTLYRFTRHLMANLQPLRLPGGYPVDMVMVLTSGEMASGLLGSTSLTYQLVGQAVAVGNELVDLQPELKLIVTSEFYSLLEEGEGISGNMRLSGRYSAAAAPCEVAVYTLAEHEDLRLYSLSEMAGIQMQKPLNDKPEWDQPSPATPPLPCPCTRLAPRDGCVSGKAASAPAVEQVREAANRVAAVGQGLASGKASSAPGVEQAQEAEKHLASVGQGEIGGKAELQEKGAEAAWYSPYARDVLLTYKNPDTEERYSKYQIQKQREDDAFWSMLGLISFLAYYLVARSLGSSMRLTQVLSLHILPFLMRMWLRRTRPDFYTRYRDDAALLHRLLVVVACSLPGSFAFADCPSRVTLAYGTVPVLIDVVGHRSNFRLQLASSVVVHVTTLLLMGLLESPWSTCYNLSTADLLALHFATTTLLPCMAAYVWETYNRKSFEAAEEAGWKPGRAKAKAN